jgi:hypothetical protein
MSARPITVRKLKEVLRLKYQAQLTLLVGITLTRPQ